MSRQIESITPRGSYQECLEHALVLAHILERTLEVIPADSELWHRGGVELGQFSGWITKKINAPAHLLNARRHRNV